MCASDRPQWLQDWIAYFWRTTEQEKIDLAALRDDVNELKEWKTTMSAEFDAMKAKVETMETLLQTTADGLVAVQKSNAALQLQLSQPNPDTAAMVALASEVDAKLASVTGELPAPTPAPATGS